MKKVMIGCLTAAFAVWPALADDVPFAQPGIGQPGFGGQNRLSDIMASIQTRHAKLWLAGSVANWPLAAYELGQIKDRLIDAAVLYRNIPVQAVSGVMQPIDAAADAIKARNKAGFASGFAAMTANCNACHQMADVGFIAIKRPIDSPFGNQLFEPARK